MLCLVRGTKRDVSYPTMQKHTLMPMKKVLPIIVLLASSATVSAGTWDKVFCKIQNAAYWSTPSIVWAAQHCSSVDVFTELKQGNNPNDANWCQETALHWAAHYSQSVIANYLLEHNADPSRTDVHGKTPLHWAFSPDAPKPLAHNKVVAKLLKAKTDPNIQDELGRTPLHYAVIWPVTLGYLAKETAYETPQASAIALLFKYGASPNIRDNEGNTPLHLLLQEADTLSIALPFVQFLLSKGANTELVNNNDETAWDIALKRSDHEQASALLCQ